MAKKIAPRDPNARTSQEDKKKYNRKKIPKESTQSYQKEQ